ncbi:MAG: DUF885 domain-containing protein [Candidatus Nanopelagicales bacterium]|nr:DUF885 domain-containing protein [Candidatus Nanopelagicales bacterium]
MFGVGIHSPEDRRFVGLASGVVDDILVRDPVHATRVGDHRFDSRLPDPSPDTSDEFARILRRHSDFLESVDDVALSRMTAADLYVLRSEVSARLHELTVIRPHEWNPLAWNPADALHSLLERPFAPPADRARSLVGRLELVGEFLDNARHCLRAMPRPHIEVAIAQMAAIEPMLDRTMGDLGDVPGMAEAAESAVASIGRHVVWLADHRAKAAPGFSMGATAYEGVLRYRLGTPESIEEVLATAESDLDRVGEELGRTASKLLGKSMGRRRLVEDAMDKLAGPPAVDDESVLEVCGEALQRASEFVAARRLVSVPPMDLRLVAMPEVHRGVRVAYCDAPGSLERAELPTVLAVAPTAADWTAEQRQSFYREYNRDMIFDLMVHEAMPGHALQLAWARSAESPTAARSAFPSQLLIEGWATYAEEMMARNGFVVSTQRRPSLRFQQLKMQLRMIINTILEISIHTQGMTEAQGRRLMATRGYQEESEIIGKWRRASVTYGELPARYIGYRGVAAVVKQLAERHRGWNLRQVHDRLLAQGSIAPEHLPSILGLG